MPNPSQFAPHLVSKIARTTHTLKDTAISLASIFVPEVSAVSCSWWSNGRARSSSSIRSNLLARIETRKRKIDGLISLSWTSVNILAIMLQIALSASVSSEANGNTSNRPFKKFRSDTNQIVTVDDFNLLRQTRKLHRDSRKFCYKEVSRVLPSDNSEAKLVASVRMFAINTAAVTQELATCRGRLQFQVRENFVKRKRKGITGLSHSALESKG